MEAAAPDDYYDVDPRRDDDAPDDETLGDDGAYVNIVNGEVDDDQL
jgi:hypothetical protein